MADREIIVFSKTHAAVGARLLSRWSLPPAIIVAVLNHHGSPVAAGPFEKLAACVAFGNLLAHSKIDGKPPESDLTIVGSAAAGSLGINASAMPGVLKEFEKGLKRSEALLHLVV